MRNVGLRSHVAFLCTHVYNNLKIQKTIVAGLFSPKWKFCVTTHAKTKCSVTTTQTTRINQIYSVQYWTLRQQQVRESECAQRVTETYQGKTKNISLLIKCLVDNKLKPLQGKCTCNASVATRSTITIHGVITYTNIL